MHEHQFLWAWFLQFLRYGYLSKTAKFPFPTMDYSPCSSKNLIDRNWLKKFMQVGIDVTCMPTSFGGCGFFGFGRNRRSVQLYDNNYSIIIIIIIDVSILIVLVMVTVLVLMDCVYVTGLLSISLFYNHYYYHYFTKISITLPLPLQFKNHTINYITIIIKTTLITNTITLASVLHYITLAQNRM